MTRPIGTWTRAADGSRYECAFGQLYISVERGEDGVYTLGSIGWVDRGHPLAKPRRPQPVRVTGPLPEGVLKIFNMAISTVIREWPTRVARVARAQGE